MSFSMIMAYTYKCLFYLCLAPQTKATTWPFPDVYLFSHLAKDFKYNVVHTHTWHTIFCCSFALTNTPWSFLGLCVFSLASFYVKVCKQISWTMRMCTFRTSVYYMYQHPIDHTFSCRFLFFFFFALVTYWAFYFYTHIFCSHYNI